MHALLIHQAFVTPEEPGGTRHFELAREFVKRGSRFTIVASDLNYLTGRGKSFRGLYYTEDCAGVNIRRVATLPKFGGSFLFRIASFVSFMLTATAASFKARDVDVVIGTSPPIFQALSSWLVAFLRKKPFLLEIRDLWPEFAIDIGILRNGLLIKLSRRLERFLYNIADHIVVNSPAYINYISNLGIPAGKISLIPNGTDTEMFDPSANGKQTRRSLKLNGHFVVTYAGALGLANDVSIILKAAALLKNEHRLHFLVVGDGSERRALEQLAASLKLKNLTLLGSVPKSAMPDVLSSSDICVATLKDIPMFRTTYPNKVFDYMAAGRAVVLAIDGVIRDLVEMAACGVFVQPGNEIALAHAIQKLFKDPEKAKKLGAAGRKFVLEHFDRKRQADHFFELVGSLDNFDHAN